MTKEEVFEDLKKHITQNESLKNVLGAFIKHYSKTDIVGYSKDDDSDMLLFQWGGPYSWSPDFSVNLTRQFSSNNVGEDYHGMEQLSIKKIGTGSILLITFLAI